MTQRNKAALQALFQTNDVPTGTDFGDMIDSAVNAADTSAQTMAGNLTVPVLAATSASIASGLHVAGAVSAGSLSLLGALTAVTAQTTASGSAGGAGAVPATVAKYLVVTVSGAKFSIPLFKP